MHIVKLLQTWLIDSANVPLKRPQQLLFIPQNTNILFFKVVSEIIWLNSRVFRAYQTALITVYIYSNPNCQIIFIFCSFPGISTYNKKKKTKKKKNCSATHSLFVIPLATAYTCLCLFQLFCDQGCISRLKIVYA